MDFRAKMISVEYRLEVVKLRSKTVVQVIHKLLRAPVLLKVAEGTSIEIHNINPKAPFCDGFCADNLVHSRNRLLCEQMGVSARKVTRENIVENIFQHHRERKHWDRII